jgi:cytochrome P450
MVVLSTTYSENLMADMLEGNSLPRFRSESLNFLLEVSQNYGDLVHMRFGPRHVYLVNSPDLVREVLVEQAEKFYKTPLFKRNARHIIGEGLLTSEGELHKRQRRLMQPTFYHQRIAGFAARMVESTQNMLDGWHDGAQLDIHHEMMRLTLEIVSQSLFGANVSHEADLVGEAITGGLRYVNSRTTRPFAIPYRIPTPENLAERKRAKTLHRVVQRFIDERRASGEDRGDLLSMILLSVDEQGGMSDQQALDEVMTLFIAGHETTANALTWTFYLLAQNPEVEAKLFTEVDRALGGLPPTMDDLTRLPYTDQVIKESMRLYPPAWIVPREANQRVMLDGHPVAKNSILLSSPYTMQRSPRYFPDPDRFVPERFTGDFEKSLPRYAYFPFGGGPRVCIGNGFAMMEARLLLATIVQQYQLALVPDQTVIPEPVITLRPRDGIQMCLIRRERLHEQHLEQVEVVG